MWRQNQLLRIFLWLAVMALGLAACGGGGSSSTPRPMASMMRLSVADAPPADGAPHVVVQFTGVELTGNGGNPVTITFSTPKTIDLVTQGGTASAELFNQPIPPGSYGQVRLMVNADGNANDSFIVLADGTMHGLIIPSGAQTGLKLVSGFTVPSSGVVDYTIDFDLRKAITCPPGQGPACLLKPALRLVNNTTVGNIQGQITSALPSGCTPGVYLYAGTVTRPEDMNSSAPSTDTNQPIASKVPDATTTPPFYYQFTFLAPGTYTVAFTCQAAQDNPDQADASVILIPVATTTVTANATQTVNITLGAIAGAVASSLVTASCSPGVYLYSGNVTSPEDVNHSAPSTDANQPITTQQPVASSTPPYSYMFSALPPGTYTLAFTCQASADNPAQADAGVTFNPVKTGIVVTADQTTTANLP
jgi:Domain of unknown function (DUF4382)